MVGDAPVSILVPARAGQRCKVNRVSGSERGGRPVLYVVAGKGVHRLLAELPAVRPVQTLIANPRTSFAHARVEGCLGGEQKLRHELIEGMMVGIDHEEIRQRRAWRRSRYRVTFLGAGCQTSSDCAQAIALV